MKLLLVLMLLATPQHHTAYERNRAQCHQNPTMGVWHVKQLIRCEVHWLGGVPGGVRAALRVAWHESRFLPGVTNGTHDGLYQQARRYWKGRHAMYARSFPYSAFRARTNIMVSLRMVKSKGTWCQDWYCVGGG